MKVWRYEVNTIVRTPGGPDHEASELGFGLNRLADEAPHQELVSVVLLPDGTRWAAIFKSSVDR